jgi:hypothetical protein
MESPRFYHQSNSPSFIRLQQQIYRKEERSLGLSDTPLRLRFESYFKEKVENFQVSPQPAPEITSQVAQVTPQVTLKSAPQLNSQMTPKMTPRMTPQMTPLKVRIPTINESSVQEARLVHLFTPSPLRSQEKKTEDLYRSRISAATKSKDLQINPKGEIKLFPSVFYNKNQDLMKRLNRDLNTKRIIKGKGYGKSYIFND